MVNKINGFVIEKYFNDSTRQFELRVSSKNGPLMEALDIKIKEWLKT